MEKENNKSRRLKIVFIVAISIICVFLVYYTAMSMMSPSKKLSEIREEFVPKSGDKEKSDQSILTDADYLKLMKQKSFLQSRIVMAETDSIYLTINLADSTVNLEISGVVVHKAKMSELKTSSMLRVDNDNAILSLLAKPFNINSARATIKKEPVMVKVAPKDTSEYKPDVMPDTSITDPVYYVLEMNHGLRIYVYQTEDIKFDDKVNELKFDLHDRLNDTWSALKSVAEFKVPEYHPYIKMRLPRSDAKIIYRAIPRYGQIAVSN